MLLTTATVLPDTLHQTATVQLAKANTFGIRIEPGIGKDPNRGVWVEAGAWAWVPGSAAGWPASVGWKQLRPADRSDRAQNFTIPIHYLIRSDLTRGKMVAIGNSMCVMKSVIAKALYLFIYFDR
jgi:hypothetical protein